LQTATAIKHQRRTESIISATSLYQAPKLYLLVYYRLFVFVSHFYFRVVCIVSQKIQEIKTDFSKANSTELARLFLKLFKPVLL